METQPIENFPKNIFNSWRGGGGQRSSLDQPLPSHLAPPLPPWLLLSHLAPPLLPWLLPFPLVPPLTVSSVGPMLLVGTLEFNPRRIDSSRASRRRVLLVKMVRMVKLVKPVKVFQEDSPKCRPCFPLTFNLQRPARLTVTLCWSGRS